MAEPVKFSAGQDAGQDAAAVTFTGSRKAPEITAAGDTSFDFGYNVSGSSANGSTDD